MKIEIEGRLIHLKFVEIIIQHGLLFIIIYLARKYDTRLHILTNEGFD